MLGAHGRVRRSQDPGRRRAWATANKVTWVGSTTTSASARVPVVCALVLPCSQAVKNDRVVRHQRSFRSNDFGPRNAHRRVSLDLSATTVQFSKKLFVVEVIRVRRR